MSAPPTQRRLAAILAADVVGYSRMMAEDEAGTLAALRTHRQDVFDPETAKRGGRIVKLMGDGTLVEFPSVVDAVETALAIQQTLAAQDGPIKLRIGINLGDVIIEDDDIYGDGVNIAARLETLAEPGGICISSIVHESLGNRIDIEFVDAGEHEVKNIARPIRVYRWPAQGAARLSKHLIPPELKRKHTISVPDFENLSTDAELGYFCEGITQSIITALGTIAQLTVVSDEHRVDNKEGDRAAARYLLTGKLQKAGGRLRLSAQLVDRATGEQCWADRFDRDAADLFEVQDDVTRKIVTAVHMELGFGGYTDRWQRGTENFEAWQLMAKAFHAFQPFSPESAAKTATMCEAVLKIDPDYLAPSMASAFCYARLALTEDQTTAQTFIARAQAAVERSLAKHPDDATPYVAKSVVEIALGNYEAAIAAVTTAIKLEPDNPPRASLALALMSIGEAADGLVHINKAIQATTDPPGWFRMVRIQCNYMLGNLTEALDEAENLVTEKPEHYPGPGLAAALAVELGRTDLAGAMCQRALEQEPQFSARTFVRWQGLKSREFSDRLFDALTAAGLPE